MSGVPLELWRDCTIGEWREALVLEGRPIALRVLRASDAGRRARWGETYAARVRTIDRRRRGAFLDMGLSGAQGFLPLDASGQVRPAKGPAQRLTEGALVTVGVAREAARGKGPVVALMAEPPGVEAPGRLTAAEQDIALMAARPADVATRAALDAAFEDALMRTAPIPGGGVITIEPTAALVAIDVDSGARQGPAEAERFALELNIAAAAEIARQVRLRALGGVLAIDFVSLRAQASRKALLAAAKDAFAGDPWPVHFGMLSPFGVLEVARAQLTTPLHELLRDPDGRLTVETAALGALRALEKETRNARGRMVEARLAPDVHAWLEAGHIPWREALLNRIGARWSIVAAPGQPRDRLDVRAV